MRENEEILDWDFYLENPPLRTAHNVEMVLEHLDGEKLQKRDDGTYDLAEKTYGKEFWEWVIANDLPVVVTSPLTIPNLLK